MSIFSIIRNFRVYVGHSWMFTFNSWVWWYRWHSELQANERQDPWDGIPQQSSSHGEVKDNPGGLWQTNKRKGRPNKVNTIAFTIYLYNCDLDTRSRLSVIKVKCLNKITKNTYALNEMIVVCLSLIGMILLWITFFLSQYK